MVHSYTNDLTRGLAFLKASAPDYQMRQDYYNGDVPEVFGSRRIRRAMRDIIKRYKLNFSATPVDALLRRVTLASAKVVGSDPITKVIEEQISDPNELDQDLDFWFKRAAYFGDYYILAEANVESSDDAVNEDDPFGDPANPSGDVKGVSLYGKDPLSTAILYNQINDRMIDFGIQKWPVPLTPGQKPTDQTFRVNLYYDDETYQMQSKVGTKGAKPKDYGPLRDIDLTTGASLNPSIPNPFGFPLFHLRADDKPYGIPVHEKSFGAQDAIVKSIATHMGVVDFIGWPQRWALLDPQGTDDNAAEDFGTGLESGFEGGEGTRPTRSKSGLSSGPGELWWLEGIKEVGQFEQADTDKLINGILFYIKAIGKLTETPLYEFDLTGNEPSGEARRRADGPIDKHVGKVEDSYGATVEALLEYCLAMLGYDDENVTVSWAPAEIVTDKDGWETINLKTINGLPLRQALLEAGYDQSQIDEWYPKDTVAVSLAMFAVISEGLRMLSVAADGGIVSAVDAAEMLPTFLVANRPEAPEPKITYAVAVADPTLPAPLALPAAAPAPATPPGSPLPPLE